MSDVARAIEQAASSTVDENLWWDCHESLFEYLDKFVSSSGKLPTNGLVQKLQANHSWLLDMLLRFKPPSVKSRSALDVPRVVLGGHTLEINAEMKNIALQLSELLVLDEVQAYLLVSRFFSGETHTFTKDIVQKITLKYYVERQCLLKCSRLILLCHLAEPSDMIIAEPIENEAKQLVKDGIEDKVFALLQKLLNTEQPLHLDEIISTVWADEVIMEQNLVMDILFLLYYEPLCFCNCSRWKELFLLFQEKIFSGVGKLSLTAEAVALAQHAKHQALVILLEALDLDKLLLMVLDEVTFSNGRHPFSVEDLQQLDGLFAGLNPLEVQENAPLLLGWATFNCLVSHPVAEKETRTCEIEYVAYAQQAYKGGAFKYLLEMLHHPAFRECDIDGYKCVVKSLVSAFIAAFDIASQNETIILDTSIDILYAIYSGQEILCIEFWDRETMLDGPIRNLLSSLQEYFPYRLQHLVRLLAGLSEGPWPAHCVYDFLYRMVEITSLYQHERKTGLADSAHIVHTNIPLKVPGAPGLLIPAGTDGHIVQEIDEHTSLVRWQCKHSPIVILLFRLMDLCKKDDSWIEVSGILNLLCRMLSANKMLAACFLQLDDAVACTGLRGDGRMEGSARINVLGVVCMLLDKLLDIPGGTSATAFCMDILNIFVGCCPIDVMSELSNAMVLQPRRSMANYLGGGLLAKCFAVTSSDSEQFEGRHMLVFGVLNICITLIERGIQSESLSTIVLHTISNVLVNHMTWKYKEKQECWKICAKVFQLAHTVLSKSHPTLSQLKEKVLELLVVDQSINDTILRILSITSQHLEEMYVNCRVGITEREWFERALDNGMMLLHRVLSDLLSSVLAKNFILLTPLEHALLHHASGAMPFMGSVLSLIGFSRNPVLQLSSIKALTTLCHVAERAKPHPVSISSYIQGFEQRHSLRMAFGGLLSKETAFSNLELFNSALDLLTMASRFQPSLIDLLFSPIKNISGSTVDALGRPPTSNVAYLEASKQTMIQVDVTYEPDEAVWRILEQAHSLLESHPHILSPVLFLLKSLWQGGIEFHGILESFRHREGFWKLLTMPVSVTVSVPPGSTISVEEMLMRSFKYQCQTSAMQIMACDTFLQQYTACHEVASSIIQNGVNTDDKNRSTSTDDPPLLQWTKAGLPENFILSIARSPYDKKVLLRAKAEMRALLVGLMLKILAEDKLGLSAILISYLQESLQAVLDHSSFQGLLSNYIAHGYGYGKKLQTLLMSDLYFHLQGELEAGRHIPAGSFQDLVELLDTMDLTFLLHSVKKSQVEELHPPFGDGFVYDAAHLKQHLGLEWWPQTDTQVLPAAESAVHAVQCANGLLCLGNSQLSALDSFTNLLIVSTCKKQAVGAELPLKSIWSDSSILAVCTALEASVQVSCPVGNSTQYLPNLLVAQSQLLLAIVRQVSSGTVDTVSKAQAGTICTKFVRTIVGCVQPILGSLSTIQSAEQPLVTSLLGAFLICLDFIQTQSDGEKLHEKTELQHQKLDDGDAFLDVALISMGFLPVLCSFAEVKAYSNLAIAAISVLIKHFFAPETWFPILQKHFPIHFALSPLRMAEDTDTVYQVLNLFLSLARVKGGAETLQSAGFFSHIMLFSEQLKEEVPFVSGEMEGPFCVWKKRTKKNDLWGLCVSIVAATVRSLGEKDGGTAVQNALVFFESQKEQMLHALQPPCFSNAGGKKKARYQRPQTTISALQETQQVLHLMVELVRHHAQWLILLGKAAIDFREMCIHLLAYIAREGLTRNISMGVGAYLLCPPLKDEEVLAHRKTSILGCSTSWFAVTARGASYSKRSTNLPIDFQSPRKYNGILPLPGLNTVQTAQSEIDGMVPTQYSDSVALHVYRVTLLLLDFLCKHAQVAVKDLDEGKMSKYAILPEFPAPEVLHGLQDQVMSVITEVCSRGLSLLIEKEIQQACFILMGIMEKSLCLEVCVARICGISPLSLRLEDFSKEYKAMVSAAQGHLFLDAPLQAVKVVVGLAYPALF